MKLEDFLERAAEHSKANLPFVIYKKPNENRVNGLFQSNNELFFAETFKEKGFVFSPFDDINRTVLFTVEESEEVSIDFNQESRIETVLEKEFPHGELVDKVGYIKLVENAKETINNSGLEKVVVSRKENVVLINSDAFKIFKKLLNKYESAFVYYWFHPKVGIWLGATPETLLKVEGNRFSIMALAGTQEFFGSLNVQWRNKEKQEQQFVTDYILNNVKPYVSNLQVSDVKTVRAGNLLHLKTMISASLLNKDLLKTIIKEIHPTPAVCGFPKSEAKRFIEEYETYTRTYYAGFLGELNYDKSIAPRSSKRNVENRAYILNKKSTQLYVNLRCMELVDNKAQIYIGGGITKDSDPEKEWEETVLKSLVIKKVL